MWDVHHDLKDSGKLLIDSKVHNRFFTKNTAY